MTRHVRASHENILPHECPWQDCDRKFSQKVHLDNHYASHLPKATPKYECKECHTKFLHEQTLALHMEARHLGKPGDQPVRSKKKDKSRTKPRLRAAPKGHCTRRSAKEMRLDALERSRQARTLLASAAPADTKQEDVLDITPTCNGESNLHKDAKQEQTTSTCNGESAVASEDASAIQTATIRRRLFSTKTPSSLGVYNAIRRRIFATKSPLVMNVPSGSKRKREHL